MGLADITLAAVARSHGCQNGVAHNSFPHMIFPTAVLVSTNEQCTVHANFLEMICRVPIVVLLMTMQLVLMLMLVMATTLALLVLMMMIMLQ